MKSFVINQSSIPLKEQIQLQTDLILPLIVKEYDTFNVITEDYHLINKAFVNTFIDKGVIKNDDIEERYNYAMGILK